MKRAGPLRRIIPGGRFIPNGLARVLLLPPVCAVGCADGSPRPADPVEISLAWPEAVLPAEFTRILSLRELPDGRVLITDPRENRITLADFETGSAAQLGRVGQGPTEFREAGRLWAVSADSTIMQDRVGRRWLVLEGARIAGPVPADDPAVRVAYSGAVLGMDQEGHLAARLVRLDPAEQRAAGDSLYIARIDRATAESTLLARAAAMPPSAFAAARGLPAGGPPPAAPRYMMSINALDQGAVFADGWLAIARAEPYRIDWCAPRAACTEGPALPFERRAFTDADRAAVLEMASATAGWPPTTNIDETAGWPETIPPFMEPTGVIGGTAVYAAPEGRVVVRRMPSAATPANRYDIVNRAGEMEAWLQLEPNEEIVDFGPASVYITVTDALGVQRLRRHRWP